MDHTTLDDQTLIRMIGRAQPEALSALYDRYSRLVFGLALYSVGDRATAEEITQDVFVRVWQNAGQYRAEQGTVRTWLASITRHRAIDQLRRQGARPEQHSLAWDQEMVEAQPASDDPAKAAELALERQRVRAALGQLPAEQQEVLALAYFRGSTQRQIAEALGLPLGTVKTRIRLAMDKLRQMLVDERYGRG